MTELRLSGGIVLDRSERAWLAGGPGGEVDDWRVAPGAPVAVGPAGASRRDLDRARREVRRLVASGGPLVAAAGVDVGGGFRSGRLEGGGESRRDAVLAAVHVLGVDGLDRLGPRQATLVALFGARATKRVGAAALEAIATGAWPAVRLAVAVSDLLGPEQLEAVLRVRAPEGIDPVPVDDSALLGEQLATVLQPYSPPRRAALVHALWTDVVDWRRSGQTQTDREWWEAGRFEDDWWPPPSLETVPLAVAGTAQLVQLGAARPARPRSWESLVSALVASAAALALDQKLTVAGEIMACDRARLADTSLRFEVARTPRQLADWGNYMGNCIAGYIGAADESYALLALRDAKGTMVANLAVRRTGTRWGVEEARGRFNSPLCGDVARAIRAWAAQLRHTSADEMEPVAPPSAEAVRRGHQRPRLAHDRLTRAAEQLGEAIEARPELQQVEWTEKVIRSVATELHWTRSDEELSAFVAVARSRPTSLAPALARALVGDVRLVELWHATTLRPLSAALGQLGETKIAGLDLGRLADPTIPRSVRALLDDRRVRAARRIELTARHLRRGLGRLLRQGDSALDWAVVTSPHIGFVTAGVLAVTAWGQDELPDLEPIPVASDGTVPGRPRSALSDSNGPWNAAWAAAEELGAARNRLEEATKAAVGTQLLVPSAWLTDRGWTGLWSRAHRTTRHLMRSLP